MSNEPIGQLSGGLLANCWLWVDWQVFSGSCSSQLPYFLCLIDKTHTWDPGSRFLYHHNISVACYQNHAKTESIRSTICGKCLGEPPEIGSWECSKSSERNSLTRRQSYWYNLVNKIREMVSFGLGKEIEKVFFLSCHEHETRKRLRVNSRK